MSVLEIFILTPENVGCADDSVPRLADKSLFSFPFFPLFWWAALSQLSGLLQSWIIHVTRHYLDEVNNWNLCLKGFDVDERKGVWRQGWREVACQPGHTSHVKHFWLTSRHQARFGPALVSLAAPVRFKIQPSAWPRPLAAFYFILCHLYASHPCWLIWQC